jgi:DNA-binding XRE family transcriptional regulator
LRAQGLPLAKTAAEIGVSKATLVNPERELKEEIDNLPAIEFEALYDKYHRSTRKKSCFSEIP